MPKTIYIIRHCEKSKYSGEDLSKEGVDHAHVLSDYFVKIHPKPQIVYAGAPATLLGEHIKNTSNRPYQTAQIIAQRLKCDLVTHKKWNQEATEDIGIELTECKEETVLVVWEHKNIPLIAEQFVDFKTSGLKSGSKLHWNYDPSIKTKEDIYDLMFIINSGKLTTSRLP